jgi:nucleotide-binding universal stress UspA family protein
MLQRIAVSWDAANRGGNALAFGTALAQRSGARLDLFQLHAPLQDPFLESLTPYRFEGVIEEEDLEDQQAAAAEQRHLEAAVRRLRDIEGIAATAHVVLEPTAEALHRTVSSVGSDLFILSPGHRPGTSAVPTEEIVRRATVPLLLLPAAPASTNPLPGRILAALDGSPFSEQVLPSLQTLASLSQAKIVLLRVVDDTYDEAPGSDAARAEQYLQHIAGTLGDVIEAWHVITGPATPAILGTLERTGAGVVAMATHARHGISRFLLGSVTAQVLREARSAMLIVRPTAAVNPLAGAAETVQTVAAMA